MSKEYQKHEFNIAYEWWYKLPYSEQLRLNKKILGEKDRFEYADFIKLWRNKDK